MKILLCRRASTISEKSTMKLYPCSRMRSALHYKFMAPIHAVKVVVHRSCKRHTGRLLITTSLGYHMHCKGLRLGLRRYFVQLQGVSLGQLRTCGAMTEEAAELVAFPSPFPSSSPSPQSLSPPLSFPIPCCTMLYVRILSFH